jgi:aromatic-L-amino-acid decarboxylase
VVDYRDWHVPLGRRFRALKLWFVLRAYGAEHIRQMVRDHVAWAAELETWIAADPRFELAAQRHLTLVCFRHRAGDVETRRLMAAVNNSGDLYISHCELDGRFTLRFCVGQATTAKRHVENAWAAIAAAASE